MRRMLLLCILSGLAACGDDSTEPVVTTPALLIIVSGDAQVDTVGKELVEPLVVRVENATGGPIRGQVVNFRVLAGGGSVFAGVAISDEAGEARERWILGTVAGESQVVEARAVDTQTGEGLVFETFTAVGVPDAATSLEMLSDTVVLLTSIGDTTTLSAQVVDHFGNAVDPQPSIDWTSSDGSIATVFSTGVVTANGLGSTTILAVGGGLSATTRVTVEQAPNSIVLSPESISLGGPGDSTVILATVSDARGAEITVPNLTWTSSNTGVVTVDSVGLVRAVTFGSAEITVLASGGGQTAEATLSVTVDATALSVTTAELTDAVENVLYDQLLTAQGGQGGYTWALAAGSPPLPDGLALVSNGNITGVPTTPGIWNFVVQVTSGTQSAGRTLSITVYAPLSIDVSDFVYPGHQWIQGSTYSRVAKGTGGDGVYTWSIQSGSLPPGLALVERADGDAELIGTLTTTGAFPFTLGLASGDGQSVTEDLTITVTPRGPLAWYPATSMPVGVREGSAPAASDGDLIYVVASNPNRIYIYDPVGDVWTTGAQHSGSPGWFMLAALPGDGIHLISESSTSSHLVYDHATDTWSPRAAIPTPRYAGVAEVVDGKLYVIGGSRAGDVVEIYDPGTDSWTSGAGKSTPGIHPASAVIDGMIYVAGGIADDSGANDVLERYDPASDEWVTLAPIPSGISSPGGGEVDGLFCVFGGGPNASWTFCYDPASNTWTQEADMITGRTQMPSTTLRGGLYAMGGNGAGTVVEVLRR